MLTRQQQLPIAIKAMKKLGVDPDYIRAFKNKGTITQFINYAGYYVDETTEHDLLHQIRLFEATYGAMVYAVTHEYFGFGECFSFLYVSKYKEDTLRMLDNVVEMEVDFYTSAYVYNADADFCSEFGTIGIKTGYGGLKRVY